MRRQLALMALNSSGPRSEREPAARRNAGDVRAPAAGVVVLLTAFPALAHSRRKLPLGVCRRGQQVAHSVASSASKGTISYPKGRDFARFGHDVVPS